MKKYIFFPAMLTLFFACNDSNKPPAEIPQNITVTSITKIDTPKKVKVDHPIGSGLTQEELMDDSVFTDGSIPTSWEAAGITDLKGFKLFLKRLQLLVLTNDKEQLAKQIRYPLSKSIKTKEDFIKNYDRIFTKDAKLSIASINFSQIFRNSKGAMTEGGRVWFSQEGNEFKIIAINN